TELPYAEYEYQSETHDFGVEIKKLLFSKKSNYSNEVKLHIKHFIDNMQQISRIEGFKLLETHEYLMPRDQIIRCSGKYRTPSTQKDVIKKAIERSESYAFMNGDP